MNLNNKIYLLRLRVLLVIALFLGVSSLRADLVYHLTFEDQTLANSGTAGGSATATTTAAPDPVYVTDTPTGSGYALDLVARTSPTPRAEYLMLPDSTSAFSLSPAGESMSINTWLYWDGNIQNNAIVTKSDGGSSYSWYFNITSDGKLNFNLASGGASNPFGYSRTSTSAISAGEWVNVTLIWTSDASQTVAGHGGLQNLKFYINGEDAGLNVALGGSDFVAKEVSGDVIVGDLYSNGNNPLNGSLYDFRMYDTALTPEEVANLAGIPEQSSVGLLLGASVLALALFHRRRG